MHTKSMVPSKTQCFLILFHENVDFSWEVYHFFEPQTPQITLGTPWEPRLPRCLQMPPRRLPIWPPDASQMPPDASQMPRVPPLPGMCPRCPQPAECHETGSWYFWSLENYCQKNWPEVPKWVPKTILKSIKIDEIMVVEIASKK